MKLPLDEVVPWGRSFEEYVRMFDLCPEDLAGRILGCGDGPASYNAESCARGLRAVSVDPIYAFPRETIRRLIDETYERILQRTRLLRDRFLWKSIHSVEELGRIRMRAMRHFLADYPDGRRTGRYLAASLPDLPFADRVFDLAICSHLLFTYSETLTIDFHVRALVEMARIAREVRVFPLVTCDSEPSSLLEPCQKRLRREGFRTEVRPVPYEFQRGGNEMLVVRCRE